MQKWREKPAYGLAGASARLPPVADVIVPPTSARSDFRATTRSRESSSVFDAILPFTTFFVEMRCFTLDVRKMPSATPTTQVAIEARIASFFLPLFPPRQGGEERRPVSRRRTAKRIVVVGPKVKASQNLQRRHHHQQQQQVRIEWSIDFDNTLFHPSSA